MLDKYLDKKEYNFLINKVPDELKPNYDHFKLKYTDREGLQKKTKRHWQKSQLQPFFNRRNDVKPTNQVLNIIK